MNYVGRLMWERLMTYDKNWEFKPELATDWNTPDGGKTWVFHLVRNATWHDAVKFTSADVKFYYDVVANRTWPKTKIPAIVTEGYKIQDNVEFVTAPDDYTVEFHLFKPTPLDEAIFSEFSGFMCLPKHIFEGTDIETHPALQNPIGTGPFRFVKHVQGVYVEFERNKNYWRAGQPYLDKVIERFYPTPEGAVIAMEAGEIDYIDDSLYVPPAEVRRIQKDPKYGGGSLTICGTVRLTFNIDSRNIEKVPALGDPRVRRALSLTIPRKSVCDDVLFGMAGPNSQIYSLAQKWLRPPDLPEYHPYDPQKAKQLLDEAGWPVKSDGSRFDFGQIVSYPVYINVAEVIKSSWEAIGVKSTLRGMEFAAIVDRIERGKDGIQTEPGVSALLNTMGVGPYPGRVMTELHSTWLPPKGYNCAHYKSSEMDVFLENAGKTVEQRARQEAYWKVARQFDKDLPFLPITDLIKTFVWRSNVRGVPDALYPQGAYYLLHKDIWLSQPVTTTPATKTTTAPTTSAPALLVPDSTSVVVIVSVLVLVIAAYLGFRVRKRREARPD
jgi:peptide/nickel transport system substrate-binding protein